MVRHTLKSNPALRDLEHVPVDGPGLAYLFFTTIMDIAVSPKRKPYPSAHTLQMLLPSGLGDLHASMWFSLLLEVGQQCTTAVQERRRQHIWPLEEPILPVHANESSGSGSSHLVGGTPPVPDAQEGVVEQETPRVNAARPCR